MVSSESGGAPTRGSNAEAPQAEQGLGPARTGGRPAATGSHPAARPGAEASFAEPGACAVWITGRKLTNTKSSAGPGGGGGRRACTCMT